MEHITYFEDDCFSFIYTKVNNTLFLHCYVSKWKLSVLKNMISILGRFLNEFSNMKIVSITPNPKCCEMLGGKIVEELDNGLKVAIWE